MNVTVEIPLFVEILAILIAAATLYTAIADFIFRKRSQAKVETKDEAHEREKLAVKVQELEGMIETHYGELTTKLISLEKSIQTNRESNVTFENRVLTSVDKLESKIDRLQDLVIQVVTKSQKGRT